MQHLVYFIVIVLQLITGNHQGEFWHVWRGQRFDDRPSIPRIHHYLVHRSMMEPAEFRAYMTENYNSWMTHKYQKEDRSFFNLFTRDIMCQIIQLKEEWVNPAIDLEVTLSRIIAFFMEHLECDSPKQTLLILMHILSSKCFSFSWRSIAKRWRKKWEKNKFNMFTHVYKATKFLIDGQLTTAFYVDSSDKISKNLETKAFFLRIISDVLMSNPTLQQEILNFEKNEAIMLRAMIEKFETLTKFFLTNGDGSFHLQDQICVSTCNLVCRIEKNDSLWYQMMMRKFHLVQNMDKKFRVRLIRRSDILFILIWRIFNQSHQNRIRKIPLFMNVKLMPSRWYFYRFFPGNPNVQRFLSLPMHPK